MLCKGILDKVQVPCPMMVDKPDKVTETFQAKVLVQSRSLKDQVTIGEEEALISAPKSSSCMTFNFPSRLDVCVSPQTVLLEEASIGIPTETNKSSMQKLNGMSDNYLTEGLLESAKDVGMRQNPCLEVMDPNPKSVHRNDSVLAYKEQVCGPAPCSKEEALDAPLSSWADAVESKLTAIQEGSQEP
eukprot:Gb_32891 [translate_table: standard]